MLANNEKQARLSLSGVDTRPEEKSVLKVIYACLHTAIWKCYVFQKFLLINPFFNYVKFFRKIDEKKYRRCRKYICLQIFGERALRETFEVCKQLKMKPFLLFGTLLGHQRENGFIEHDSDMDIGLLREDFLKIDKLRNEMRKKGYIVRGQSEYGISFKKLRFKGLNIDFYLVYEQDSRMVCVAGIKNRRGRYYYPRDIFSEFTKVNFSNSIGIFVPAKTDEYLEMTYGDWKTPNVNFDMRTDCKNLEIEKSGLQDGRST